jgi:uncharacterized membrane protein
MTGTAQGGDDPVTTTAWRFRGTEGADEAILRLTQLDEQDLIDVHDVTLLRWPQYAAAPTAQEHVTAAGGKMSSLMRKAKGDKVDPAMIESVKEDMSPGTSALVLLSTGAEIDQVARALHGQGMELIRSDLSVSQQDRLRSALADPDAFRPDRPS